MKALRRFIAISMSVVYLWTNVLAAHAAESNFWAERRRGVQQSKLSSSHTLLASAATAPAQNSMSPDQQRVLAELPNIAQVSLAGGATAPNQAAARPGSHLPAGPLSRKEIPSWLSKVLSPYGSVREIHLAKSSKSPFIIHIQDAHGIEDAQRNMASIIETVASGLRPAAGEKARQSQIANQPQLLVGVEGASGGFDFAPYRDFPDPDITRDVADYFLKEGFIGAPEYAGLTTALAGSAAGERPAPSPLTLWGLEDLALYEGNIKAFRDSLPMKERAETVLRALQDQAGSLKEKIHSAELKEFDRHFNAYNIGTEGLGPYVKYLTSFGGQGHPNLAMLTQALSAESTLDFKRVESERLRLVQVLVKNLSQDQISQLVSESLRHRAGETNYADYYQFLKNLCRRNGIDLKGYGPLNDYVEYVLLAERINRNKLLDELSLAERDVENNLAAGPEQKRLVAANRNILLLKKLLSHSMTMADWVEYDRDRERILGVDQELGALAAEADLPLEQITARNSLTSDFIRPFEDFCRLATLRNGAFVENLLKAVKRRNKDSVILSEAKDLVRDSSGPADAQNDNETFPRIAVLVAGGFHSDGLAEILRAKNVSYMVVTPKIAEVPKDNNYLDVFARDPLPLEKILEGEKIYLVKPLVFWQRGEESINFMLREIMRSWQNHDGTLESFLQLVKRNAEDAGLPIEVGNVFRGKAAIRAKVVKIILSSSREKHHAKLGTVHWWERKVPLGKARETYLSLKWWQTQWSNHASLRISILLSLVLDSIARFAGHLFMNSKPLLTWMMGGKEFFVSPDIYHLLPHGLLDFIYFKYSSLLSTNIIGLNGFFMPFIGILVVCISSYRYFSLSKSIEEALKPSSPKSWGKLTLSKYRQLFWGAVLIASLSLEFNFITEFGQTVDYFNSILIGHSTPFNIPDLILMLDGFLFLVISMRGGGNYLVATVFSLVLPIYSAWWSYHAIKKKSSSINGLSIPDDKAAPNSFFFYLPALADFILSVVTWNHWDNRFTRYARERPGLRAALGIAGLVVEIPLLLFWAWTAPLGSFLAILAAAAALHGLLRTWEAHAIRAGPTHRKSRKFHSPPTRIALNFLVAFLDSFAGFMPYGLLAGAVIINFSPVLLIPFTLGVITNHFLFDQGLFQMIAERPPRSSTAKKLFYRAVLITVLIAFFSLGVSRGPTPPIGSGPANAANPVTEAAYLPVPTADSYIVTTSEVGRNQFQIHVNEHHKFIVGMGYNPDYSNLFILERRERLHMEFANLKAMGVNTVTTWGLPTQNDPAGYTYMHELLEEANKTFGPGSVILGWWMPYDGNWNDPAYAATQQAQIERWVSEFKGDPALLMYGIGNENFLFMPSNQKEAFVQTYDKVLASVHSIDPNHPVIYRGASTVEMPWVMKMKNFQKTGAWYGLNSYGGLKRDLSLTLLSGVPTLVTETGPNGSWEGGQPGKNLEQYPERWKILRDQTDDGGVLFTYSVFEAGITHGDPAQVNFYGLFDRFGNPIHPEVIENLTEAMAPNSIFFYLPVLADFVMSVVTGNHWDNRFTRYARERPGLRAALGIAGLVVEIPLLLSWAWTAPLGSFLAILAAAAALHGFLQAWEAHAIRAGPRDQSPPNFVSRLASFARDFLTASLRSFAGFAPYALIPLLGYFDFSFGWIVLAAIAATINHLRFDRKLFITNDSWQETSLFRFINAELNGSFSPNQRKQLNEIVSEIVNWWYEENTAEANTAITNNQLDNMGPINFQKSLQYFFDLHRSDRLLLFTFGLTFLLYMLDRLIIFGPKGVWAGFSLEGLIIGDFPRLFVYVLFSLIFLMQLLQYASAGLTFKDGTIQLHAFDENFIKNAAHETIHSLAHHDPKLKDLPFAAAVETLFCSFGIGQISDEKYFNAGKKIAADNKPQNILESAISLLKNDHNGAIQYDGQDIQNWSQACHSFMESGGEPNWTYELGAIVAGIVYERSRLWLKQNPDCQATLKQVSLAYLRQLMLGIMPEEIEPMLGGLLPLSIRQPNPSPMSLAAEPPGTNHAFPITKSKRQSKLKALSDGSLKLILAPDLAKANGAVSAASASNARYAGHTYPRDAMRIAAAWLDKGKLKNVRNTLEFFLGRPTEEKDGVEWDGMWEQRYNAEDGKSEAYRPPQLDANGLILDMAWKYYAEYKKTSPKDADEFLLSHWPKIQKAMQAMLNHYVPEDRLFFIWNSNHEWPLIEGGYGVWGNMSALAGVMAASRIADALGHRSEAESWSGLADNVRLGIHSELTTKEDGKERFISLEGRRRIEDADMSTLLGYLLGLVSVDDPVMVGTAEYLFANLHDPELGGMRRMNSSLLMPGRDNGGNGPWSRDSAMMVQYIGDLVPHLLEQGRVDEAKMWMGRADLIMEWFLRHNDKGEFPEHVATRGAFLAWLYRASRLGRLSLGRGETAWGILNSKRYREEGIAVYVQPLAWGHAEYILAYRKYVNAKKAFMRLPTLENTGPLPLDAASVNALREARPGRWSRPAGEEIAEQDKVLRQVIADLKATIDDEKKFLQSGVYEEDNGFNKYLIRLSGSLRQLAPFRGNAAADALAEEIILEAHKLIGTWQKRAEQKKTEFMNEGVWEPLAGEQAAEIEDRLREEISVVLKKQKSGQTLKPSHQERPSRGFMLQALWEAVKSHWERPLSFWPAVGAVIVDRDGHVIGRGYNSRYLHAEERAWLSAIQHLLESNSDAIPLQIRPKLEALSKIRFEKDLAEELRKLATEELFKDILAECSAYVSLSPCPRCVGILAPSGISEDKIWFAAKSANPGHSTRGTHMKGFQPLAALLTGPLYYFVLGKNSNLFDRIQKYEKANYPFYMFFVHELQTYFLLHPVSRLLREHPYLLLVAPFMIFAAHLVHLLDRKLSAPPEAESGPDAPDSLPYLVAKAAGVKGKALKYIGVAGLALEIAGFGGMALIGLTSWPVTALLVGFLGLYIWDHVKMKRLIRSTQEIRAGPLAARSGAGLSDGTEPSFRQDAAPHLLLLLYPLAAHINPLLLIVVAAAHVLYDVSQIWPQLFRGTRVESLFDEAAITSPVASSSPKKRSRPKTPSFTAEETEAHAAFYEDLVDAARHSQQAEDQAKAALWMIGRSDHGGHKDGKAIKTMWMQLLEKVAASTGEPWVNDFYISMADQLTAMADMPDPASAQAMLNSLQNISRDRSPAVRLRMELAFARFLADRGQIEAAAAQFLSALDEMELLPRRRQELPALLEEAEKVFNIINARLNNPATDLGSAWARVPEIRKNLSFLIGEKISPAVPTAADMAWNEFADHVRENGLGRDPSPLLAAWKEIQSKHPLAANDLRGRLMDLMRRSPELFHDIPHILVPQVKAAELLTEARSAKPSDRFLTGVIIGQGVVSLIMFFSVSSTFMQAASVFMMIIAFFTFIRWNENSSHALRWALGFTESLGWALTGLTLTQINSPLYYIAGIVIAITLLLIYLRGKFRYSPAVTGLSIYAIVVKTLPLGIISLLGPSAGLTPAVMIVSQIAVILLSIHRFKRLSWTSIDWDRRGWLRWERKKDKSADTVWDTFFLSDDNTAQTLIDVGLGEKKDNTVENRGEPLEETEAAISRRVYAEIAKALEARLPEGEAARAFDIDLLHRAALAALGIISLRPRGSFVDDKIRGAVDQLRAKTAALEAGSDMPSELARLIVEDRGLLLASLAMASSGLPSIPFIKYLSHNTALAWAPIFGGPRRAALLDKPDFITLKHRLDAVWSNGQSLEKQWPSLKDVLDKATSALERDFQTAMELLPGHEDVAANNFKNFSLGQFSHSRHFAVVELARNSLHAARELPAEEQDVSITLTNSYVCVEDPGEGMDLGELEGDLLTFATTGAKKFLEIALNFGLGFFSVFSHLSKVGDRVVLETFTDPAKGGFRMVVERVNVGEPGSPRLQNRIRMMRLPPSGRRGTRVEVFGDIEAQKIADLIRLKFRYHPQGRIRLNGEIVNQRKAENRMLRASPEDSLTAAVLNYLDPARDNGLADARPDQRTLTLTIDGLSIMKFDLPGARGPRELELALPPGTEVNLAREQLAANREVVGHLRALIDDLARDLLNVGLMSDLAPVCEHLDELLHLGARDSSLMRHLAAAVARQAGKNDLTLLPNSPALHRLKADPADPQHRSYRVKTDDKILTAAFIHPSVWKKLPAARKELPFRPHPGWISWPFIGSRVHIIPGEPFHDNFGAFLTDARGRMATRLGDDFFLNENLLPPSDATAYERAQRTVILLLLLRGLGARGFFGSEKLAAFLRRIGVRREKISRDRPAAQTEAGSPHEKDETDEGTSAKPASKRSPIELDSYEHTTTLVDLLTLFGLSTNEQLESMADGIMKGEGLLVNDPILSWYKTLPRSGKPAALMDYFAPDKVDEFLKTFGALPEDWKEKFPSDPRRAEAERWFAEQRAILAEAEKLAQNSNVPLPKLLQTLFSLEKILDFQRAMKSLFQGKRNLPAGDDWRALFDRQQKLFKDMHSHDPSQTLNVAAYGQNITDPMLWNREIDQNQLDAIRAALDAMAESGDALAKDPRFLRKLRSYRAHVPSSGRGVLFQALTPLSPYDILFAMFIPFVSRGKEGDGFRGQKGVGFFMTFRDAEKMLFKAAIPGHPGKVLYVRAQLQRNSPKIDWESPISYHVRDEDFQGHMFHWIPSDEGMLEKPLTQKEIADGIRKHGQTVPWQEMKIFLNRGPLWLFLNGAFPGLPVNWSRQADVTLITDIRFPMLQEDDRSRGKNPLQTAKLELSLGRRNWLGRRIREVTLADLTWPHMMMREAPAPGERGRTFFVGLNDAFWDFLWKDGFTLNLPGALTPTTDRTQLARQDDPDVMGAIRSGARELVLKGILDAFQNGRKPFARFPGGGEATVMGALTALLKDPAGPLAQRVREDAAVIYQNGEVDFRRLAEEAKAAALDFYNSPDRLALLLCMLPLKNGKSLFEMVAPRKTPEKSSPKSILWIALVEAGSLNVAAMILRHRRDIADYTRRFELTDVVDLLGTLLRRYQGPLLFFASMLFLLAPEIQSLAALHAGALPQAWAAVAGFAAQTLVDTQIVFWVFFGQDILIQSFPIQIAGGSFLIVGAVLILGLAALGAARLIRTLKEAWRSGRVQSSWVWRHKWALLTGATLALWGAALFHLNIQMPGYVLPWDRVTLDDKALHWWRNVLVPWWNDILIPWWRQTLIPKLIELWQTFNIFYFDSFEVKDYGDLSLIIRKITKIIWHDYLFPTLATIGIFTALIRTGIRVKQWRDRYPSETVWDRDAGDPYGAFAIWISGILAFLGLPTTTIGLFGDARQTGARVTEDGRAAVNLHTLDGGAAGTLRRMRGAKPGTSFFRNSFLIIGELVEKLIPGGRTDLRRAAWEYTASRSRLIPLLQLPGASPAQWLQKRLRWKTAINAGKTLSVADRLKRAGLFLFSGAIAIATVLFLAHVGPSVLTWGKVLLFTDYIPVAWIPWAGIWLDKIFGGATINAIGAVLLPIVITAYLYHVLRLSWERAILLYSRELGRTIGYRSAEPDKIKGAIYQLKLEYKPDEKKLEALRKVIDAAPLTRQEREELRRALSAASHGKTIDAGAHSRFHSIARTFRLLRLLPQAMGHTARGLAFARLAVKSAGLLAVVIFLLSPVLGWARDNIPFAGRAADLLTKSPAAETLGVPALESAVQEAVLRDVPMWRTNAYRDLHDALADFAENVAPTLIGLNTLDRYQVLVDYLGEKGVSLAPGNIYWAIANIEGLNPYDENPFAGTIESGRDLYRLKKSVSYLHIGYIPGFEFNDINYPINKSNPIESDLEIIMSSLDPNDRETAEALIYLLENQVPIAYSSRITSVDKVYLAQLGKFERARRNLYEANGMEAPIILYLFDDFDSAPAFAPGFNMIKLNPAAVGGSDENSTGVLAHEWQHLTNGSGVLLVLDETGQAIDLMDAVIHDNITGQDETVGDLMMRWKWDYNFEKSYSQSQEELSLGNWGISLGGEISEKRLGKKEYSANINSYLTNPSDIVRKLADPAEPAADWLAKVAVYYRDQNQGLLVRTDDGNFFALPYTPEMAALFPDEDIGKFYALAEMICDQGSEGKKQDFVDYLYALIFSPSGNRLEDINQISSRTRLSRADATLLIAAQELTLLKDPAFVAEILAQETGGKEIPLSFWANFQAATMEGAPLPAGYEAEYAALLKMYPPSPTGRDEAILQRAALAVTVLRETILIQDFKESTLQSDIDGKRIDIKSQLSPLLGKISPHAALDVYSFLYEHYPVLYEYAMGYPEILPVVDLDALETLDEAAADVHGDMIFGLERSLETASDAELKRWIKEDFANAGYLAGLMPDQDKWLAFLFDNRNDAVLLKAFSESTAENLLGGNLVEAVLDWNRTEFPDLREWVIYHEVLAPAILEQADVYNTQPAISNSLISFMTEDADLADNRIIVSYLLDLAFQNNSNSEDQQLAVGTIQRLATSEAASQFQNASVELLLDSYDDPSLHAATTKLTIEQMIQIYPKESLKKIILQALADPRADNLKSGLRRLIAENLSTMNTIDYPTLLFLADVLSDPAVGDLSWAHTASASDLVDARQNMAGYNDQLQIGWGNLNIERWLLEADENNAVWGEATALPDSLWAQAYTMALAQPEFQDIGDAIFNEINPQAVAAVNQNNVKWFIADPGLFIFADPDRNLFTNSTDGISINPFLEDFLYRNRDNVGLMDIFELYYVKFYSPLFGNSVPMPNGINYLLAADDFDASVWKRVWEAKHFLRAVNDGLSDPSQKLADLKPIALSDIYNEQMQMMSSNPALNDRIFQLFKETPDNDLIPWLAADPRNVDILYLYLGDTRIETILSERSEDPAVIAIINAYNLSTATEYMFYEFTLSNNQVVLSLIPKDSTLDSSNDTAILSHDILDFFKRNPPDFSLPGQKPVSVVEVQLSNYYFGDPRAVAGIALLSDGRIIRFTYYYTDIRALTLDSFDFPQQPGIIPSDAPNSLPDLLAELANKVGLTHFTVPQLRLITLLGWALEATLAVGLVPLSLASPILTVLMAFTLFSYGLAHGWLVAKIAGLRAGPREILALSLPHLAIFALYPAFALLGTFLFGTPSLIIAAALIHFIYDARVISRQTPWTSAMADTGLDMTPAAARDYRDGVSAELKYIFLAGAARPVNWESAKPRVREASASQFMKKAFGSRINSGTQFLFEIDEAASLAERDALIGQLRSVAALAEGKSLADKPYVALVADPKADLAWLIKDVPALQSLLNARDGRFVRVPKNGDRIALKGIVSGHENRLTSIVAFVVNKAAIDADGIADRLKREDALIILEFEKLTRAIELFIEQNRLILSQA